ncbi:MAG TPA: monofunctional biosynthetic peptidoglycan transglycosylase [Gemmatimonadales bacterium]|nr:monofunctional biosynthetic peptidoglycan transglycosylase [Gemmatimonadales bacterium]
MAIPGAFVAASAYWWLTWPDVEALADRNPETTAFIERYRESRRAAGQPDRVAWRPVPYERISLHLKRAVVAAEDLEFFSHRGFSSSELKAAITKALREMEAPRGASTITQQLAKNLWLSPSRNPLRKLKEAVLTRQLERHLSKRRILELYLNVVEFGRGVYGAEAAAQAYFGKAADALTEEEAAQLAASLPRPATWHPGVTSAGYRRYVSEIRRRMDVATFLWRAVGGGRRGSADTIPIALPDLDSLLRAVQDSIRIPDTPLVDTGAGQIADTPQTRRETPLVRTDSIR